jgi:ABC-type Zn2+ transport system substrate-binding protein/surface adhesin
MGVPCGALKKNGEKAKISQKSPLLDHRAGLSRRGIFQISPESFPGEPLGRRIAAIRSTLSINEAHCDFQA